MKVKIGAKIKELRKRDDITQERLAEGLGVTSQAISKWEGESGYPDIECVAPIADFFNVTIDYLFDHDTEEKRKKIDEYRDIVRKIQNIQDASHHLLDLINDVLGMPKAEESEGGNPADGYFVSNMHEIRIPIDVIREMASIGADTADVEKKDRAIQRIQDASNHLLGIINDILDFSNIEAGKLELSASEFDFAKMAQKITGFVGVPATKRGQKLTVAIDPAIPSALIGDEGRLAQVIMNLLSNAIKFTLPEGSIDFDARLQSENDDVCSLLVSVADTGIGISREQQEIILNHYEQTEKSTRRYGGTGLGLTIAKGIIEQMGGEIWVESEVGKGSTFSFTVCLVRGKSE